MHFSDIGMWTGVACRSWGLWAWASCPKFCSPNSETVVFRARYVVGTVVFRVDEEYAGLRMFDALCNIVARMLCELQTAVCISEIAKKRKSNETKR